MKQLKTPIEILSEKCGFDTISKYTYVVDKDCALEAIESYHSQFEDKWIDVKIELPKKQGCYLVIAPKSFPKNCPMLVAEFYEDNNIFYSESGDNPMEDVTHWMPLPSNPK